MTDSRSAFDTVALAVAVGLGGYIAIVAWVIVLTSFAQAFTPAVDPIDRQLLNAGALALGTLLTVRVFLAYTDRDLAYLDLDRPTVLETAAGLLAIPVLLGVTIVVGFLGVTPAEHGLEAAVREGGYPIAVTLAVTSLLVVGPAEELLYRNLVQKTLAERFSSTAAIVGASIVFATVHTTAYWTGTTLELLSALALVFVLSTVLGVLYARTSRVVVPAIAHGGYDAVVFLLISLDHVTV